MEDRALVEKLYISLELHKNIFSLWVKFMIMPTIFGISCGVIVTIYVSIRHTELPFYFYMFFPYTGVMLMFVVFWFSYDAVCILRHSEEVLNGLLDYEAKHLRGKGQKMNVMKRASALRAINFPMGSFAEFSLNVPINIWEEVLNQLLFLLSF